MSLSQSRSSKRYSGKKRAQSQSPEASSSGKKQPKRKMILKGETSYADILETSEEEVESDEEFEEEEEVGLEAEISRKVRELASLRTLQEVKTATARPAPGASHRRRRESGATGGGKQISDFVQELMAEIKPMIVSTIKETIQKEVKKTIKEEVHKMKQAAKEELDKQNQYLQQQVLKAKYDNDSLEQHGRKGSVRISGIPEEAEENVPAIIQKVAEAAGVTVTESDISACHRLGPKRDRPRNIICKFVSRQTKYQLMQKRKNLKEKEGYARVYVNEDLTMLRRRLLDVVRKCPQVSRANSKDGKIFVTLRNARQEDRPVIVESPDDLFKLGCTDIPYDELGLSTLLMPE